MEFKVSDDLIARFNSKFEKSAGGCWNWTASLAGKGYGQIKIPGTRRQVYAHRLSYMIHVGDLPAGRHVCHSCDNPKCVNPSHLFVGTARDNLTDAHKKGRLPAWRTGEGNPNAVLKRKQVDEIRALISAGMSQQRIAQFFGVSQITVSRIHRGTRWGTVK